MPPPKAPTRTLHDVETAAYLVQLGELRRETIRLEEQLRRGSIHRGMLDAFVREIDELARVITGEARYFHGRR